MEETNRRRKSAIGRHVATKLLDTNVCVALIRGQQRAIDRYVREFGGGELRISAITVFELVYGADRSGRVEEELTKVRRFFDDGPVVVDLTRVDAASAAHLRADLAGKGQMIGAYDLLIAGQALARGWRVVTANTREFARVEGLALEDWSQAPA
jgi:tRNA(fMet)-specific endonuclease VapC